MSKGVIEFDHLTKVYPGASSPAVNDLTLRIESGEICALVGPSGGGKTTVMRMVNRLIEPTSGEIRIDGVSNRSMAPQQLRRSIGYVIQQVGLFPHHTIAQNVGTVPELLGWSEGQIHSRVNELLDLVGLDPSVFGQRSPSELSGGQRQRVGVARALAADPPIMLMDEPFGAIDPVVRGQIQDEFLRLQREVKKTIVIVTHDIDEALKMGDRIAVLQAGGILAQQGSPLELLSCPNSEFVAEFIGADSALKRLGLHPVREAQLIPLADAAAQGYQLFVDATGRAVCWASGAPAVPLIPHTASLRDALSEMLASDVVFAPVVDDEARPIGIVSIGVIQAALRSAAPQTHAHPPAPSTVPIAS